ncbi:MAG TPA: hypothetical protein GXZ32_05180 [Clostridiales bacterium]|nr:hypothetical protein [Clostridiales bacterium]
MDDKDLDRMLKAAKDEAHRFFSKWSGEDFREKVYRRISQAVVKSRWQVGNRLKRLVPIIGAVAVCIAIMLWVPGLRKGMSSDIAPQVGNSSLSADEQYHAGSTGEQNGANAGIQTSSFTDFLPIDQMMGKDYNLLVVIWKDSNHKNYEMVYNFIPYRINGAGQIALTTKRVEVQVGHYLVLVGNDHGNQVDISFQGNTIKQLSQNKVCGQYRTTAQFYAYSPGREYIIITPRYDTKQTEKVLIEVNDKDSR